MSKILLEIRDVDGKPLYTYQTSDSCHIVTTRKDPRADIHSKVFGNDKTYIKTHFLKCIAPFYSAVWSDDKPFEIRFDDRDYKVGDYVVLREYDPETNKYSGSTVTALITYIIRGTVCLKEGYCAFTIKIVEKKPYVL